MKSVTLIGGFTRGNKVPTSTNLKEIVFSWSSKQRFDTLDLNLNFYDIIHRMISWLNSPLVNYESIVQLLHSC